MKQHVQMFESFVSHEGPSFRGSSWGSDRPESGEYGSRGKMSSHQEEDEFADKRVIAAKTAKLIGELTRLSTNFNMNEPDVRSNSAPFMQKYLSGRGVSEDEAETFLKILAKLTFGNTSEKKKIDQDGDGDTDFVDAKIAQYKKGGMPKAKAISSAKMFAKKNNIKDVKTKK